MRIRTFGWFAVNTNHLLSGGVRKSGEDARLGHRCVTLVFGDTTHRNAFVAKSAQQQFARFVIADDSDRQDVDSEIGEVINGVGTATPGTILRSRCFRISTGASRETREISPNTNSSATRSARTVTVSLGKDSTSFRRRSFSLICLVINSGLSATVRCNSRFSHERGFCFAILARIASTMSVG